jgi:4-methylaminobutanoate oxidase (formaldehyde-forming)
VTSGSYGHTLGGSIGLGYVDTSEISDAAELAGDALEIEVAGVRIQAEASLRPMYDPDNKRIRC